MRFINEIIKILLSILFIICLLQMPYWYYEAVRFIAFVGFMLLAYLRYIDNLKLTIFVFIYITLALLFQPFLKIALGRTVWNIVDVLVSIGLIGSLLTFKKANSKDGRE